MNSSLLSLITYCWLCFLLIGINNLTMYAQAQPVDNAAKVVHVPINTDRSLILWKGTEMWESGKHEGTVTLKEGYLLYKDGQLAGGHFIADMNSITITDIPAHEPVPRKRLRNHLKSEDFFYVEKYPTAAFKITTTEVLKADSIKVWGDLSIRDVTESISFIASKESDQNSTLVLNATFKIDRYDWNISYQGSYWDRITSILDNNLVDNEIWLSVTLVTQPLAN